MAIQFTQTTPQGVSVNYNIVDQLNYDPQSNTTWAQLISYINQASFANGDASFPAQGFTLGGQLSVTDVENQIIARPEWAGATIVS
jgi:hypothetical protein